jgi:hypothetical protein
LSFFFFFQSPLGPHLYSIRVCSQNRIDEGGFLLHFGDAGAHEISRAPSRKQSHGCSPYFFRTLKNTAGWLVVALDWLLWTRANAVCFELTQGRKEKREQHHEPLISIFFGGGINSKSPRQGWQIAILQACSKRIAGCRVVGLCRFELQGGWASVPYWVP